MRQLELEVNEVSGSESEDSDSEGTAHGEYHLLSAASRAKVAFVVLVFGGESGVERFRMNTWKLLRNEAGCVYLLVQNDRDRQLFSAAFPSVRIEYRLVRPASIIRAHAVFLEFAHELQESKEFDGIIKMDDDLRGLQQYGKAGKFIGVKDLSLLSRMITRMNVLGIAGGGLLPCENLYGVLPAASQRVYMDKFGFVVGNCFLFSRCMEFTGVPCNTRNQDWEWSVACFKQTGSLYRPRDLVMRCAPYASLTPVGDELENLVSLFEADPGFYSNLKCHVNGTLSLRCVPKPCVIEKLRPLKKRKR